MKQYKTKQRDDILEFFENNPSRCFSAKDIIESDAIKAGQATVYRTLNMLSEEGRLLRFRSDNGDFFKLACHGSNHLHIVCEECGSIIHADCDFVRDMAEHFEGDHGFIMNPGKTVIYGKCSECAGKNAPDNGKDFH